MSSIIKVNTVQDTDGNNIINENANTITIGKSGDTVQVASGASLVGAGIEWQSSIVTAATLTASSNEGYWIDTTSNACTITLPASPAVGDQIIFTDYARKWGTNAVTINPNSKNFQGFQTPQPVYDTNGESVDIVYSGTTKGWIPNNDGSVVFETSQSYDVEYLVVAGGGSGGTGDGAGAGAGGYLTNVGGTAIGVTPGEVYTIVVGAGGAGVPGSPKTRGNPGVNSTLSGSGITTITAIAGGGGGASIGSPSNDGLDGGSGGGAGSGGTAGSGTAPQGFDGGANTGGGGGASEAGTDGSSGDGGGGDGLQNSITGSSVYYGGGGGKAPGPGPGGQGGGTAGNTNPNPSSPSPANTGGGSGGANDQSSGNGGSGVVILSMADAKYSGTTSGSPTVATGVSGKTVLTFTGNGTYTA
mgnify:CR=1 FL=1